MLQQGKQNLIFPQNRQDSRTSAGLQSQQLGFLV